MRHDKWGIPILRDSDIEKYAEKLLSEFDNSYLNDPAKLLISTLFEYLKKDGLQISFSDLGQRDGHKILGRTIFSKNQILIDKDLHTEEPLYLFTCAHEIGHWVLHRKEKIVWGEKKRSLRMKRLLSKILTKNLMERGNLLRHKIGWSGKQMFLQLRC